jgi:hypothetical protein
MFKLRKRLSLLPSKEAPKPTDTLCRRCQAVDPLFIFQYGIKKGDNISLAPGEGRKTHSLELPDEGASINVAASDTSSITFVNDAQSEVSTFADTASVVTVTPSTCQDELPPRPATVEEDLTSCFLWNEFSEALRNKHCPFCRLIVKYAETCLPYCIKGDCHLCHWQAPRILLKVISFHNIPYVSLPIGFIPTAFIQPLLTDTSGLFPPTSRYLVLGTENLVKIIDDDVVGESQHISISPLYSPLPITSQVDWKRLKKWLHLCEKTHTHSNCSQSPISHLTTPSTVPSIAAEASHNTSSHPPYLPRQVLNVQTRFILPAPSQCRYLALTPLPPFPDRTQDLLLWWKRDFIFWTFKKIPEPAGLPQVIEDAIKLTLALGEKYLWIRELCPLDNLESPTAIMENRENIAGIYHNAVLTIVPATGNTLAGLPGVQPFSRGGASQILGRNSVRIGGGQAYISQPLAPSLSELEDAIFDRYIFADGRDHEHCIMPWTSWQRSRGSTQPKTVLRPQRFLVFSEEQVYFCCSQAQWQENCLDSGAENANPTSQSVSDPDKASREALTRRKFRAVMDRDPKAKDEEEGNGEGKEKKWYDVLFPSLDPGFVVASDAYEEPKTWDWRDDWNFI